MELPVDLTKMADRAFTEWKEAQARVFVAEKTMALRHEQCRATDEARSLSAKVLCSAKSDEARKWKELENTRQSLAIASDYVSRERVSPE